MASLTLQALRHAVAGTAAAFRCRTEYQPAGGKGTAVFPPTYEGGKYALVGYRVEDVTDGEKGSGRRLADQVVLDSVQSQANRMEQALLDAWEAQQIKLPVITVDFSGHELERDLRVTSLEAPHRIADAILRDSLHDGKPFRKSELGGRIDDVDIRNATALFELCPTALVFGVWDSTGPKGGLGAKFQRAIVSEIMGLNVQLGVKTASRIDPLQTKLQAGPLYAADGEKGIGWTLDPEQAKKSKGKPIPMGKDGRPSEVNHGNVTPTFADGGVAVESALQTTVLSLTALRRLRFPLKAGERSDRETDAIARTALAALGLCAAALTRNSGCDLRSRCQLFPINKVVWELLDQPGEEPQKFELSGDDAIALFNDSVKAAQKAGLPWMDTELVLTPDPQLVALVKKSQELAASTGVEED